MHMKNYSETNMEEYPVDEELTGSSFLASAQCSSLELPIEMDVEK